MLSDCREVFAHQPPVSRDFSGVEEAERLMKVAAPPMICRFCRGVSMASNATLPMTEKTV
jgi:hypothetical protein